MDLKLDNDLVFDRGDLVTVDGADEVAQRIRHRLLTFRGEWFLDLSVGPDYRGQILLKAPLLDTVNAVLRQQILQVVEGEFTEFESTLDTVTRKLTIRYSLETTEAQIVDSITL